VIQPHPILVIRRVPHRPKAAYMYQYIRPIRGHHPRHAPARVSLILAGALWSCAATAQTAPPASAAPTLFGPVLPVPTTATPKTGAKKPSSKRLTLTLKAGVAYDSDVAISQINTSSGQSDRLANLGLSANYKLVSTPSHSLSIGYDYAQSLHVSLPSYDIQLHSFSASGSVTVRKATLGVTYSFSHVLLGAHPFLDLHLVNPSVLVPVTHKIFVRPSWVYLDETFTTNPAHNATHNQPGVQLFYFFRQSRAYVLLGANYQREKTAGPEFVFKGYALSASLNIPVKLLKVRGKLKAEYEWLSRDYDNITPSIGVNRFDRASTVKLGAEVPLIKKLSLGVEAKHIGRSSNVSYANLDDNVASGELIYRF